MNNILFIIDTLNVGGAERSLLEITSRFKRFKPLFVCLFHGEELKGEFKKKGIEVLSLNETPSNRFEYLSEKVIELIKDREVSLIHTTLYRSDQVGRKLKAKLKVQLINSLVNNSYSKSRYKNLSLIGKIKLFGYQFYDRLSSKIPDLYISNSEAIKLSNARALNLELNKVIVVYRGRERKLFLNPYQDEILQFRNQLNLVDSCVFINVSRLVERKGQMDLIFAFKELIKSVSKAKLLIVGEGVLKERLEKLIQQLGLQESVIMLGNRRDIPALLKASDYFIFPSYFEGLPGALIEAMFARIPIIASSIPENLECIDDSMAITFNVGDIRDMSNAMLQAVNYSNWNEKTENAFRVANERFDIENISLEYEEIYDSILI
ncbi:MAG: glycosyltransferase [Cyclobacteriaceae bacterium]|jgi:glycosyltransferase involved in cell wall biosynthesis|nr:glycosyltransferase [Cytophagales bacterium]MCZ8327598.1 glycosyltransferase [Cyclobacteriaceae bacterium]